MECGAGVQPVEGGGSSERLPLPVGEDDTAALDAPDASSTGGGPDENEGGGCRNSRLLERVACSFSRLEALTG
ncbi:MAG: hypothetical protein F4034_08365 [Chloroflexi bacterium]|nr:hypothetical protein [Chloroflexota bacterium]